MTNIDNIIDILSMTGKKEGQKVRQTAIQYENNDGIATIAINQPDSLNAMTFDMIEELVNALDRADEDDEVRVVIVTGTGQRAFCVGTDLRGRNFNKRGGDPATGEGVVLDQGGKISLRLFNMNKMVIGAVNGDAAGLGASILLAMDIRLASPHARFGFVYARRGIVPESCCSWFLPRIVGISKAMEWIATGRIVGAEDALASSLLTEVVPADTLMNRAREIAYESIRTCAPLSVAVSRRLMWRMLGATGPEEATNFESRALCGLIGHPDMAEGVASFKEKRPPHFTGSPSSDIEFVKSWWPKAVE